MNTWVHRSGITVAAAALLVIAACATPLTAPQGADTARSKLTELKADPELASRAPLEIKEAEAAVKAAEVPREDGARARHLVLMADHKVDIAHARAQSRLYEDQREELAEESERARLDSRTREADRAHSDARSARADAATARTEADAARLKAEAMRRESRRESDDLQRQIADLNARETDRGLVVTLGDLLFATGKAELKGGAAANLDKLAAFLLEYEDRSVMIEGHTDDVGSEESNFDLSERRANSVQSYLIRQGIGASRISTSGLGEGSPVSDNESVTGRQQNRRVEVIISNATAASR